MRIKLVNCPTNSVSIPRTDGIYRYNDDDNDIIVHYRNNYFVITTWDIDNPLKITQLGSFGAEKYCPKLEGSGARSCFNNKNIYVYDESQMMILDVSDPLNLYSPVLVHFSESAPLSVDIDSDGTIWAVSTQGVIGYYDLSGGFIECAAAVPELLIPSEHPLNMKVIDKLIVVAHQEHGVLVYEKHTDKQIHLLKHIEKDELCFGTNITSVCNNRILLIYSQTCILSISADDINKRHIYEVPNSDFKLCSIIEYSKDKVENNTSEVLINTYNEADSEFELSLLEVSDYGIICKDNTRLKSNNIESSFEGMFLKDDYIILSGKCKNNFLNLNFSYDIFEVYQIEK